MRVSETRLVHEYGASLGMLASVPRAFGGPGAGDGESGAEPMNKRRKRTTSSRMSASQRLSERLSEARIRMSSYCTATVNARTFCGRVEDDLSSWTGVLNCEQAGDA